jgi:hypothetical protein
MRRIGPEIRRQSLKLLSAHSEILNQIQKQIYRPVLPGRPVLIDNRMHGHGDVNTRHFMPRLIASKGLHNRNRTMLTIIRMPPPPEHAEDLAGMKVVNTAPPGLFMVHGGLAKAQTVESVTGNVAGNEAG